MRVPMSPGTGKRWLVRTTIAALTVLALALVVLAGIPPTAILPQPTRVPVTSTGPSPSSTGVSTATFTPPAGIEAVEWSPDGSHALVQSDIWYVVDAGGQTLTTGGGPSTTWLDATHYATWAPSTDAPIGDGTVIVYGLDGSSVGIPGWYQPDGLIGSGVGSLTLMPAGSAASPGPDRFVIWSSGQSSAPKPGMPLGWSRDGSTLVVATTNPVAGLAGSSQPVSIAWMSRPFNA
ncbi:MAG: hypothetical protein ACRDGI_10620, partial [Candidatus Limnocylindrales bacterium]